MSVVFVRGARLPICAFDRLRGTVSEGVRRLMRSGRVLIGIIALLAVAAPAAGRA